MDAKRDRFREQFHERGRYHLILLLSATLLMVGVGAFQYFYTRNLLAKEEERISRMLLTTNTELVVNMLEDVESSLRDYSWSLPQALDHPDSLFVATRRFLESNPVIDGACIAVVPDYYPQKGHLFETYAHWEQDRIVTEQIAGPDHDYTQAPGFIRAVQEGKDFWSDPYEYGTDPVRDLTTYSCPITDRHGRLAAVCGLDLDLSWLADTLNAKPYYPSSFGFMFSQKGDLVGEPDENRVSPETLQYVIDLIADTTTVRSVKGHNRVNVINFRDPVTRGRAFVNYKQLSREPGWTIAQVSYWKEVLAPVRKMMRRIFLMALASLLFLLSILNLFFRNERRLRLAGIREARLGSELRIAGRIQEEMLPKDFPEREDLAVYGLLTPAKEVGGDLFDYFIRDGKLFFCIGDVSGKSVPAAIVMAVIRSLFRMVSSREEDPSRMIGEMNREGCRNNASGMFVTLFVGVLDPSTGMMRYCNAGHDHPTLVGDTVEELPALANIPIGVFDDFEYKAQEAVVPPGSVLFMHTDGVTEAKNTLREQFGKSRMFETLSASPRDPEAMIRAVADSVGAFVGAAEQSDDITMLAVGYNGPVKPLKTNDNQ